MVCGNLICLFVRNFISSPWRFELLLACQHDEQNSHKRNINTINHRLSSNDNSSLVTTAHKWV